MNLEGAVISALTHYFFAQTEGGNPVAELNADIKRVLSTWLNAVSEPEDALKEAGFEAQDADFVIQEIVDGGLMLIDLVLGKSDEELGNFLANRLLRAVKGRAINRNLNTPLETNLKEWVAENVEAIAKVVRRSATTARKHIFQN